MTVSSTTTKNSYSGDGSTTTFAYAFKIFADADLTVILRSAAGTETVQTLTTNYTVTNAGNANGGNVVFVTAPASGVTVVIRRNMAQTQSTDYVANDPFPAATHEDALDRLTFIAQQQQEELDRSIKLSRTNTMTSTEFTVGATDRANKVLAFDGNGELSVTQELGTYKGTDATVTTEAYVVRDIIKSTTAGQLNNVYICVADAVVGDLLTDTDHFELLVDAVTAATSATNAASSASAAATSESNAATSESNAATSASNAATSESNASTSETNAATSATSASNSATSAASSATTATTKASEASTSATNAATSESNASTSATNAATSATNASTSETNAATSATTATTQASAASTSASNAATSASNASTSEANAAASAAAAAASADTFDDTYLGSKSSDPSVDNDGDALNAGDLYFNTTSNTLKVYTGSAWQDAAIDSSGFVQTTGDTMTGNLLLPNGAVGTPAISFSSDTNTGIYRGGTDILKFVTAGTDAITIDASQNVGIGTTSPSSYGGTFVASGTGSIINARSSSGTSAIGLWEVGSSRFFLASLDGINGLAFVDGNGSTERMRIDNGGNVGIGTSSPFYTSANRVTTSINGGTGGAMLSFGISGTGKGSLFQDGDNLKVSGYPGYLYFATGNTDAEHMRIDSSGKVGIGTSSPNNKLTLEGSVTLNPYYSTYLVNSYYDGAWKYAGNGVAWGIGNNFGGVTNGTTIAVASSNSGGSGAALTWNPAFNIDSSGNVGIGTTSPATPLHINSSTTPDIRLEYESVAYSTISADSGAGSLLITANDGGAALASNFICTTKGTGSFIWQSGSSSTERMRIDSSGNLLVGTTNSSPYNNTAGTGFAVDSGGYFSATREGVIGYFNRNTSNGDIVEFRKDGTKIGVLGVEGNNSLYIGTSDTGFHFSPGDVIRPWNPNTNASRDAAVDLGLSAGRFKDLYLSGGVYLGGTGSANYLDDYEEGTFEVTLAPHTSGTITPDGTVDTLAYTKVGRMVTITGVIVISSVSSPVGDYVTVSGLPFAVADLTQLSERPAITATYFDISLDSYTAEPGIGFGAASYFRIYRPANTWAANDGIYVNFSYFTA